MYVLLSHMSPHTAAASSRLLKIHATLGPESSRNMHVDSFLSFPPNPFFVPVSFTNLRVFLSDFVCGYRTIKLSLKLNFLLFFNMIVRSFLCVSMCLCFCVCVSMSVCLCVCVLVYMYLCKCLYACVCDCVYLCVWGFRCIHKQFPCMVTCDSHFSLLLILRQHTQSVSYCICVFCVVIQLIMELTLTVLCVICYCWSYN